MALISIFGKQKRANLDLTSAEKSSRQVSLRRVDNSKTIVCGGETDAKMINHERR